MRNVVITPRAYPSLRRLVSIYRFLSFFFILAAILGVILGLFLITTDDNTVTAGLLVLLTSITLIPIYSVIMLAVAEMITLSTDMAGDLYYLTMSVNKVEVVNIADLEPNMDLDSE